MKKFFPFLFVIVLILASLACNFGATGAPQKADAPPTSRAATQIPDQSAVQLGETYRNDVGGFAFRAIPGYELATFSGMVNMTAPGADPDTGPVVTLIGYITPAEKTSDDLYTELKRDTPMTVGAAEPISVQGIPGLAADITGDNNGKSMRGRVALVMATPLQQFVLMVGAPEAQWDEVAPYFDAVLASVEFFEPVIAPPTSSLTPGWYAFTNANVVRDLTIYKGVVHAATLGGLITWRLDSGYSMHYTTQDGMSHVSTYSIVYCEIPEPRILVGTSSGISVYDPNSGLWKQELAFPAESRVDVSKIERLYCDQANNRLLIGYNGLGILDLKTNAFERFTSKEGLSWDSISDIAVAGKDIWIATGYNGVNKISAGKVTVYNKDNGLPDERAHALAVAKDGTLWVGASSGIMSFKGNKWTMYGSDTPAKLSDINEIEIAPDGKIWVVTAPLGTGRLCQFNPKTAACDVDFKEMDKQAILALALDESGNPIYGTSKGVYVFENGTAIPFKTDDKLASNFVDSFASAPDTLSGTGGKMWVGTDGGIHLLDPAEPDLVWQTFRKYDTEGLGGSWASGIAAAPDGTTWVAIINGYASRYQNGTWTSFKDIYSFNVVTVDNQNRAWFGDDGKGIIVLNADGSQALKLTTAEGLPSDKVYTLLTDLSGRVWIGTDSGLAKYENGALEVVFGKDDTQLPNKYIRALALDTNGALIIGTFTSLARYDGRQVETLLDLLKDGYSDLRLTTVAVGLDGRLWVGTDKGLLYADTPGNWNLLTTKDYLLTNYISALHVDQYGAVWIGGGGSNFDGGGMLQYVP